METEGLYTLIWGPVQWQSMHNITFNYPYNPTEEDKKNYYNYFQSLTKVLPCCTCRKHYTEHLNSGETKLKNEDLKNRETLTKWLYNFHKAVCKRLGFDYDITYDMVCKKHNSYIAKCDFTRKQKKEAFINLYDVHAPVLKIEILLCFSKYAEERGLKDYEKKAIKYSQIDRESDDWYYRNQKCQEIIKHMRTNGICGIEEEGEYTGMPSLEELKLMSYASTTIYKRDIKNILKAMLDDVKNK
jgi:hypothetical protein